MAEKKPGTGSLSTRRGLVTALIGVLAGGWSFGALGQGYGAPGSRGAPSSHRKISKAVAHYQYHPNGGMRCGICRHYRGGTCEIVAGRIPWYGWCRYFSAGSFARGLVRGGTRPSSV